jgi:hypothetical protein
VALSKRTNSTKVLRNQILCEWQAQLKMKNPCPKTGRPWYQPSVQNMKLRTFFSKMKANHGWEMNYSDDFRGYEGSLSVVLKTLYKERGKTWVSHHRFE